MLISFHVAYECMYMVAGCRTNEFLCHSGDECWDDHVFCNDQSECDDESDEDHCSGIRTTEATNQRGNK